MIGGKAVTGKWKWPEKKNQKNKRTVHLKTIRVETWTDAFPPHCKIRSLSLCISLPISWPDVFVRAGNEDTHGGLDVGAKRIKREAKITADFAQNIFWHVLLGYLRFFWETRATRPFCPNWVWTASVKREWSTTHRRLWISSVSFLNMKSVKKKPHFWFLLLRGFFLCFVFGDLFFQLVFTPQCILYQWIWLF